VSKKIGISLLFTVFVLLFFRFAVNVPTTLIVILGALLIILGGLFSFFFKGNKKMSNLFHIVAFTGCFLFVWMITFIEVTLSKI
jgi:hypothetical protein